LARLVGTFGVFTRIGGARFLILLAAITASVCSVGCRRAVEVSSNAVPLGQLERDPAEEGGDGNCWPGWRGFNGQGIARGGSPPIRFGPDESCRWRVAVPGKGHSSPVVWNDVLLLTSALGDGSPPRLAVLCFRRRDGELLWQAEAGQAKGRTHTKNGHASASVTTDGERIYAFFGATGLFCFDFSGKKVWHAELGSLDHIWGTASSPVLYGDLVIQLCDAEKDSYIVALDKFRGEPVWRTPRPSSGCWTTPVVTQASIGGERRAELVVNGTGGSGKGGGLVLAYDPAVGNELWRVRGTTDVVTPMILIGDGLVYSASGRNGPIMAIRPGGSGDVTDTRVNWKAARGGPYIPSGLVYRNRLYLVGDGGVITCYNAGDGTTIWRNRLRGTFSASLVAADGRLYATNERGTVYVIAASDDFELLGRNELGDRCLATPAVVGKEIIFRTQSYLYCMRLDPPR
jgi:outer membrane protein assembly factor BamB